MSEQVRIGMIGCGQIGNSHIKTYKTIPEAKIVVFCDANEAAAISAAEFYGSGEVVTDFREVLARDDVDAVDVCLHNNFHATVTNEA